MILLTFALYIRVILEWNQYILISWVSEIYHFNCSSAKRIFSIIIAFLVLIVWMAIIVFMIFLSIFKDANKTPEIPVQRSKFAHLFNGVTLNTKSRLFIWLLLIRRAVFVSLLITVEPVSSILVISILAGLQLIYVGLLVFIRPYELAKCNIIEITNEIYFLSYIASLLRFNTASDWEGTPTTVYSCWVIKS